MPPPEIELSQNEMHGEGIGQFPSCCSERGGGGSKEVTSNGKNPEQEQVLNPFILLWHVCKLWLLKLLKMSLQNANIQKLLHLSKSQ